MRILTVSNLYPPAVHGGYELGCAQAVRALRQRGHEVVVLTAEHHGSSEEEGVERTLQLTDVYDLERVSHTGPLESLLYEADAHILDVPNVEALMSAVEVHRPDVVYLWNLVGVGGLGLAGAVQHAGVPWVWHLMDCVPRLLSSLRGHVVDELGVAVGRYLRGHWVSCSRGLIDEIEVGGVSLEGDVHEISNWIEGPPPTIERRYYSGGHLRVAFAGQIGRHKGAHIIVDVARTLRDRGVGDVAFDLFGASRDDAIEAQIADRGVGEMVRLRGTREQTELVELYSDYDLFIFPTWAREPFGFAPLEAQARGCVPLVSSDCGYSEWFVDGVHCLKADRYVEDFADVITDVVAGRVALEPIARRGQAVAWRDFHVDTVIAEVETVLERAAATAAVRDSRRVADVPRLARLADGVLRSVLRESSNRRLGVV